MPRLVRTLSVATALAVSLIANQSAQAATPVKSQVLALAAGSNTTGISSDSYTLTYASCSTTALSGRSAGRAVACSSGNNKNEVRLVSSGRAGTALEILNSAGIASNILSGNARYAQTLAFKLSILPTTGIGISNIAVGITGTASASKGGSVAARISGGNITGTTTIALPSAGGTGVTGTGNIAFNSLSPVNAMETINISLSIPKGTTFNLNSVSLALTPAPEPASIAMLGSGLVGLVVIRRHGRRRSHSDEPDASSL